MCKAHECEHVDIGKHAIDRVPIHRLNGEDYRPIVIPFGAHLPHTLLEHDRAEQGGHCNAQSQFSAAHTIEGIDKTVALLGYLLAFPKLFSRAATVRKAASDSIRALTVLKAACEHFKLEKNHVPGFIQKHEAKQVGRLSKILRDEQHEIFARDSALRREQRLAEEAEEQMRSDAETRQAHASMDALRAKAERLGIKPESVGLRPKVETKPTPVRKPRPKKKAAKKAKSRPRTPSTSKALQPAPMPKLIAERMAGSVNGHTNGVLNGKH